MPLYRVPIVATLLIDVPDAECERAHEAAGSSASLWSVSVLQLTNRISPQHLPSETRAAYIRIDEERIERVESDFPEKARAIESSGSPDMAGLARALTDYLRGEQGDWILYETHRNEQSRPPLET